MFVDKLTLVEKSVEEWQMGQKKSENTKITGKFFEEGQKDEELFFEFQLTSEEIFCQTCNGIKSLKLFLTVIQEGFYLQNHKRVYTIKFMKENYFTIIRTYKEQLFINFYVFLSKYCVMKNFKSHYNISDEILGKGAFCKVYNGVNRQTQNQVALKIFNKNELKGMKNGNDIVINEILNLEKLRKHNLSPLIEVYECQDSVILVLHKAKAGCMIDYICCQKNYDRKMIKIILKNVLESLKELHDAGFVHRDIKPENILFQTDELGSSIFLTDFGLSVDTQACPNSVSKLCSGTPGFLAPQVLYRNQYSSKSDIYSVGCMMYFLYTGKSLFDECSLETLSQVIYDSQWINQRIDRAKTIQSLGKQFLKSLLSIKPSERLSGDQALKHKYFQNLNNECFKSFSGEDDEGIKDYIKAKIKKYWE